MKSFIIRALSAIVAVAGILALYYFFQDFGFKILVAIAVFLGGSEAVRVLFTNQDPRKLKWLFYALNLAVFFAASLQPEYGALVLSLVCVMFASITVIASTSFTNLAAIREFLAKGLLGFIYVGILPSFAWRLIDLPHGVWWFAVLLSVVFAGDIGAYIFGSLWGKTKLIPKLSPKKSLQGSMGGLCGSALAAFICSFLFPYAEWQYLVVLALFAGLAGQLGDFFESLLKRVADLKDSGNIMPGHGGVLDRIDGVIFASPVIFFGAVILEKIL